MLASTLAVAGRAAPPVFVTLGTGGGPVVQIARSQPANAVIVDDAVYLFDVGEGTQRQLRAADMPLANIRAVFLSHHHIDHVGGLWPLLVNRWINVLPAAIPVFGPPGTKQMIAGLTAASAPVERAPLALGNGPVRPIASTVTASDLGSPVEPIEVYRDEHVKVSAILVDHYHQADGSVSNAARSYAFRIEAKGRSLVYSGDTGPSAGLERLARGADLLVCEVIDRDAVAGTLARLNLPAPARAAFMRHIDLDHLTPEQVGAVAARAGVKALVLTHLAPGRSEPGADARDIARVGKEYTGPVTVAHDGQRF